jgi:hypothetical protein
MKPLLAAAPLHNSLPEEQRRTEKKQPAVPLFLRSLNRRRPRISAENELSLVNNLRAKQRKTAGSVCVL